MISQNDNNDKQLLFDRLLDLLIVFCNVCYDHNIHFYVFGGTMLGTVRHKGFIPWDDDIDLAVPREDYNKLKKIAHEGAFRKPYFFQNPETDPGFPKGYCRLRNSVTTEIPVMDVYEKCNHGIFIDIFPLDFVPNDEASFDRQVRKLTRIRTMMNACCRYCSGVGATGASRKEKIGYAIASVLIKLHMFDMTCLYQKYENVAAMYFNTPTNRVSTIAGTLGNQRFVFNKEHWESGTIWMEFESIKVPVPKAYDHILRHSYGDYMNPRKEATNHGETFFSASIPYTKYMKDNMEMLMAKRYEETFEGREQNR